MSKIIQLDPTLANQIAAGEVVERPISVVKELVENAIDAGAQTIKIQIEEGGIKKIEVSDNGQGISKEDLPLVVKKYSTSKIKNLDDLYQVMTFGFRGEAMASISSVSDMQIITKQQDSNTGHSLEILGGVEQTLEQIATKNGTKVIVENLFYNTPARLNYLKKARTEYNHIYKYLQEIALVYPAIGFEFISDNKEIFKYRFNEEYTNRIYHIYGKDVSENMLDIHMTLSGITVSGYISDPKVNFGNKNRQHIFVNKRPIKSFMIIKAIQDAYNRFIPHGTHPAYMINLEVDPTQVDVNVHPRKLEVRFANEQNIFRAIYHAVEERLQNVSLIKSSSIDQPPTSLSSKETIGQPSTPQKQYYTGSGTKFKSYSPYKDVSSNPAQGQITAAIDFSKSLLTDNQNTEIETETPTTDLHYTKLGKIIGQTHNSYIIVEDGNKIIIYDQHALAERIIYEKLIHSDYKVATQGLLMAENIKVMSDEIDIIENNRETFTQMGFDLEILPENIVLINAIPDFIKKENIEHIFLGILEDIGKQNFNKSTTLEEVKNKIFAYTACRSAIKFGHKLSLFEINKLLNDGAADYSATCPHGRPVIYEIDLEELKGKYER